MKKTYYDNSNQKKVGVALLISGKAEFVTSYPAHWQGRYSHSGVGKWLNIQYTTLDRWNHSDLLVIYTQSTGQETMYNTQDHLGLHLGTENKQWLWRLALQCQEKEGVFPGSCGRMCLDLSNFIDRQGTESCYSRISRNCSWFPKVRVV